MGHSEVARLPRSTRWRVVVELLNEPRLDAPRVARAACLAAERYLRELGNDPSLSHCFWLLTRLAAAARGDEFETELARLGIYVEPNESVLHFVVRVADQTRVDLGAFAESGPFGEIAAQALRRTLVETVGTEGQSFLFSSVDDLETHSAAMGRSRASGISPVASPALSWAKSSATTSTAKCRMQSATVDSPRCATAGSSWTR